MKIGNQRINRRSNIELLRVIAMLMIVVHHVICHGIMPNMDGHLPILLCVLDSCVILGVNLFILISGYFLIKLSWKSFINLMYIIAFYKIFHLFVDVFILNIEHSWYEWVLKPFSGPISGGGWFVDIYVILMLVSPLINRLLNCSSRIEYLKGLCILLILDVGYGAILEKHFDTYGYGLLHFVTMYYIGYGVRHHIRIGYKLLGWLLIGSLLFSISLQMTPFTLPIKNGGYNNPLVILSSYSIFSLFEKLKMRYYPGINFIATSIFPVYLIHDGGNVGKHLYTMIGEWWRDNSTMLFSCYIVLFIICLFVFTLLIDIPRKWLSSCIVKRIAGVCQNTSTRIINLCIR